MYNLCPAVYIYVCIVLCTSARSFHGFTYEHANECYHCSVWIHVHMCTICLLCSTKDVSSYVSVRTSCVHVCSLCIVLKLISQVYIYIHVAIVQWRRYGMSLFTVTLRQLETNRDRLGLVISSNKHFIIMYGVISESCKAPQGQFSCKWSCQLITS